MRSFYLAWPHGKILQTPSAKSPPLAPSDATQAQSLAIQGLAKQFRLPWSAYVRLLSVKNPDARVFYETEAQRSGWSVRQLDRQIGSQFYERVALSKNKAAMLEKARTSESSDLVTAEEAIKDPFVLEFLDLKDEYSESDLEQALIQHLADFLLELGDDFAFLGRQRRLRIDDNWFRIDLIFFHRRLRCLVIIDLKVGKFSYADAGQMHLYLNYAHQHWTKPGENPPVGLILCAEKGAAEAHYALDNLPNKVLAAEYQTVLPDEKLIAAELTRSRRELEDRASVRRIHRKSPTQRPKKTTR
jgi:predicted nuclease of restriction endonuclease-like (RecB) superfamily